MKNTRLVAFVCLIPICSLASFGQESLAGPRTVHTSPKPGTHTPAEEPPPSLTRIYSNLGSAPYVYNGNIGNEVAGPSSNRVSGVFEALSFTAKVHAHVTVIKAAISYVRGANQVNLSLYSDAGGVPGAILAGPYTVSNLPTFGTCCALATWNLSTGVAVTAGTRY
jgi:hypothetical protein